MDIGEPNDEIIAAQAAEFAKQIETRQLPIDGKDAYAFAQALISKNAPRGMLKRIAEGLDFYDQETFERDLKRMFADAQDALAGRPYNAYFIR